MTAGREPLSVPRAVTSRHASVSLWLGGLSWLVFVVSFPAVIWMAAAQSLSILAWSLFVFVCFGLAPLALIAGVVLAIFALIRGDRRGGWTGLGVNTAALILVALFVGVSATPSGPF